MGSSGIATWQQWRTAGDAICCSDFVTAHPFYSDSLISPFPPGPLQLDAEVPAHFVRMTFVTPFA